MIRFSVVLFAAFPLVSMAGKQHVHSDDVIENTGKRIEKVSIAKMPPSLLSCSDGDYPFTLKAAVENSAKTLGFKAKKDDQAFMAEILGAYGFKKKVYSEEELFVSSLVKSGHLIAAKMYIDEMKPSTFKIATSAFLNSSFSPSDHEGEDLTIKSKINAISSIKRELGIIFQFPEVRYFALSHVFVEPFSAYASGAMVCSRGFSPAVLKNISASIEKNK